MIGKLAATLMIGLGVSGLAVAQTGGGSVGSSANATVGTAGEGAGTGTDAGATVDAGTSASGVQGDHATGTAQHQHGKKKRHGDKAGTSGSTGASGDATGSTTTGTTTGAGTNPPM